MRALGEGGTALRVIRLSVSVSPTSLVSTAAEPPSKSISTLRHGSAPFATDSMFFCGGGRTNGAKVSACDVFSGQRCTEFVRTLTKLQAKEKSHLEFVCVYIFPLPRRLGCVNNGIKMWIRYTVGSVAALARVHAHTPVVHTLMSRLRWHIERIPLPRAIHVFQPLERGTRHEMPPCTVHTTPNTHAGATEKKKTFSLECLFSIDLFVEWKTNQRNAM